MEELASTRVPALRLPSSFYTEHLFKGLPAPEQSFDAPSWGQGTSSRISFEGALISKPSYNLARMTVAPGYFFVSRCVRIRDFRRRRACKFDDLRGRVDRERLASRSSEATPGANFVHWARGSLLNDFFRFDSRIRPFSRLRGLENVGSVSRRLEFSSFCTCQASR